MCLLSFVCRHRYASGFELDIAFQLNSRVTSLFGPSGSGKTSVLSIIAGVFRPQQGSVRLNDRLLSDTASRVCLTPANRGIGYVFQDALLFPHLTVQRNLQYGQRHRRNHRRTVEFSPVVEVLQLEPLLSRYPHSLSGGERQRVALGRALLSGPELLMMDEPLASLDDPLKSRILTYLERISAEWNLPTLFVTHSQAEVRRAAQWVVVMEKGRIVGEGLPDDALTQPAPLMWTNSAGPVNLLRIDHITATEGHVSASVAGQSLFLPVGQLPSDPPGFIQCSPSDVTLSRQDVAGLSIRNHLRGCVCRVLPIQNTVFVAVDIGQILWAQITPQAASQLQIAPGTSVICLLKAHSLTLVQ